VTWAQVLAALLAGQELSAEAARWAMEEILAGSATDAQIAAFLSALRAKGETAGEVGALVDVMLQHANRVDVPGIVLDVVGTGGDQAGTVNISTMAAIVSAAAGATVVKHGNRAASSLTGTADVLEELGIRIELSPAEVADCVDRVGIAFCFAPMHHPALRHALGVRKELGVPTVFNILGPLSNPAGANAALVGSANQVLAPVMAQALADRGVRALVVRGDDGLDEMSVGGATTVWDATNTDVVQRTMHPSDVGIAVQDITLLVGGDPARNADLLRQALGLVDVRDVPQVAAIRDAVALNSAGALVVWDIALGAEPIASDTDLIDRVGAALQRARDAFGEAGERLEAWRALTAEL
jgi:anthranilate phosphoribosyltransferase